MSSFTMLPRAPPSAMGTPVLALESTMASYQQQQERQERQRQAQHKFNDDDMNSSSSSFSSCSSSSSSSSSSCTSADSLSPLFPDKVKTDDNNKGYHSYPDGSIYYFGYGALVNATSRQRRGVKTCQAQAASLPDYRLTFALGGAANIRHEPGWECHGILMKCATPQDFEILQAFDTGYDCIAVQVYPYHDYWNKGDTIESQEDEQEEDGQTASGYRNSLVGKQPIWANVFVMHADHDKNHDLPTDRLPQERYLRVIASGMESYGVDDGYIQEEIMGVPYIPSRKPENYLRFPADPEFVSKTEGTLPQLTLQEWDHYCQERLSAAQDQESPLILIRVGSTIIQLEHYDVESPFCKWVASRILGPTDATWCLMQTLFDPDLYPRIDSADQVGPTHYAWAENQLMEKFEQAGLSQATAIIRLILEEDEQEQQELLAAPCPAVPTQEAAQREVSSGTTSTTTTTTDDSYTGSSNSFTSTTKNLDHSDPAACGAVDPTRRKGRKQRNRLSLPFRSSIRSFFARSSHGSNSFRNNASFSSLQPTKSKSKHNKARTTTPHQRRNPVLSTTTTTTTTD